ncbi:hypothetical protein [Streptomyces sp. NPDC002599]|uniref:hypothetical protein n=1 Tax=Streptomyces sp. NPDC002599 TaxID=3154421 RepID=UPI003333306F
MHGLVAGCGNCLDPAPEDLDEGEPEATVLARWDTAADETTDDVVESYLIQSRPAAHQDALLVKATDPDSAREPAMYTSRTLGATSRG